MTPPDLIATPLSSEELSLEDLVSNDIPDDAPPQPEAGHPLPSGTVFSSLGGHFTYRIVGPCCRLFDRETLPWPCCRLQWRGKEPSWRRIGRRFTPDLASRNAPSYAVEILEPGYRGEPLVMTFYSIKLTPEARSWWYSRRLALKPTE
jgi:hypothetical protein